MRDVIAKFTMFPMLDPKLWGWWKKEVWCVDLDEGICCNGFMCGCHGSTWRSMYSQYNKAFRLVAG